MMGCIVKVSPRGTYIIEDARYVGRSNSFTYPTAFDKTVIVGVPHNGWHKNGINYTASILIHPAINQLLDGYAYIYKADRQDELQMFTLDEANELINACIEKAGGRRL